MAKTKCDTCGGDYEWQWTEAFDRFGFNDGDGQVETWQVEAILVKAGYCVEVNSWGLHNTIITSIRKDETEYMPDEHSGFTLGYDNPREYLPPDIVRLLDDALGDV